MDTKFRIPLLAVMSLGMAACGGSSVTLELKNATSSTTSAVVFDSDNALQASGASDQTSSVTIDSLKLPISDVGLSYGDELYGSLSSGYLYSCGSTSADGCDVELVGSALSNLLSTSKNSGTLSSGKTYASVMIGTCPNASSGATTYTVKLKAKATLGGTTYYTKTGAQYLTTTAADYSPVSITFSGCRNYTVFSQPFTYDGSKLTVNLYIDLRNVAHVYGTGSSLYSTATSGSCSVPSGTTPSAQPYICLDYPNVGGTITSGTPTLERYKLVNNSDSTKVPQILGFYFDSSGNPIGGYNRAMLSAVTTQNSFSSSPAYFKKASLASGKLVFTDYSGGTTDTTLGSGTNVTNKASTNGNFTVKDFPRPAVGASQSLTTIYSTSDVSSTVNYTVTRID